jgi:hypothetical protein
VFLCNQFLTFRRNMVPFSHRVQRFEAHIFRFVTIKLLPLTLSESQGILFYVCHHKVSVTETKTRNQSFMD